MRSAYRLPACTGSKQTLDPLPAREYNLLMPATTPLLNPCTCPHAFQGVTTCGARSYYTCEHCSAVFRSQPRADGMVGVLTVPATLSELAVRMLCAGAAESVNRVPVADREDTLINNRSENACAKKLVKLDLGVIGTREDGRLMFVPNARGCAIAAKLRGPK